MSAPDCDHNDPKLDKRGKGCRARAVFLITLVERKDIFKKPFASAGFFACRHHAHDVSTIVRQLGAELRRDANNASDAPDLVMRVVDIDLHPAELKAFEAIQETVRALRAGMPKN